MGDFVKVAKTNEIKPGQARLIDTRGRQIALFINIDGDYYAIDDTCTHQGGPLSDGEIVGSHVTCPWHGATFDIRTGQVLGPPAAESVVQYGVRVTEGGILIEV